MSEDYKEKPEDGKRYPLSVISYIERKRVDDAILGRFADEEDVFDDLEAIKIINKMGKK